MHGQTIVINDLLSFLMCKIKIVSKEKLIDSIKEFYPENIIAEAHKVLLASLPLKKSKRQGRQVKPPDILTAIYDCIDLLPKDELPVFVCKDLNKVPQLNVDSDISKISTPILKEVGDVEEELKRDENIYKREQKQMRLQIAKMFSIITELTEGLQKLTDSQENVMQKSDRHFMYVDQANHTDQNVSSLSETELGNIEEEIDSECDDETSFDGLALIQKFIDEDEEKSKYDMGEKEEDSYSFDGDMEENEEQDELQTFDHQHNIRMHSNIEPELNFSNNVVETEISETKCEQLMYLKSKREEFKTSSNISTPEIENCIEISAEQDDYFNQMDESSVDSNALRNSFVIDEQEKEDGKNISEALDDSLNKKENGQESNYECHYCLEVFLTYKKLRKHMNSHCLMKTPYRCVLCPIKCATRDELREHFAQCFEKNKEKYKENMCLICKTYYASDKALKQHNNLHEEFRPHSCPHCPFKYLNKDRLDAHIKNQHSPLKTLVCPFCPHSAITNAYLTKHMKVHTGEAPFLCKTCGHKSKTKFQLKRHMELHGPLRERKCDKCDFVCVGLNHYLRHRRKQHGQPIVCQICNQSFKQSDTFIRHFTLHTKNKPYKCDQCLYRATVKETLRLHKFTHSELGAEVCPKCNVSCRNKRNLTRHLLLYCMEKHK